MIVRHHFSSIPVDLWIDMDGGSWTTSSSVLLLQPPAGFSGSVSEVESFCFYDAESWTPSLVTPPSC